MGSPAARLADICSGHDCHPPRPNVQGSPNTLVNGRPFHRQGDEWAPHCCIDECHPSNLASGSTTVFVNGLMAGRIGDPVACGSVVVTGSHNVIIGG